jgi:hypothetical protein
MPTFTANSISTVCSIASYYGINLEILRSSEQPKEES